MDGRRLRASAARSVFAILCLIVAGSTTPSAAQQAAGGTISGAITSADSGEPIPGAVGLTPSLSVPDRVLTTAVVLR